MSILVTGAGGFVGRGITAWMALHRPGETIHACDMAPATGPTNRAQAIAYHAVDVTNRGEVDRLFDRLAPELVIHAAALTLVAPEHRLAVFDVNMCGTLNVVQAAARCGASRIVVASSSGVYADHPAPLRHEDDPLDLGNAYAASKRAAEGIAATFGGVAVRIGPVYGPHEAARPSRPRISAIGRMLDHLRRGVPLSYHGGAITRDWTHVDDIAAGIDATLRAPHLRHSVYNLSSGVPVTLSEVAAEFARHGLVLRESSDPETADIVQRHQDARPALSLDRLRADTGFAPRLDLSSGIAAAIAADASDSH